MIKKLLIILSISLLSLTLIGTQYIKADTPVYYNACKTEIVTNQQTSHQYCMPETIYNGPDQYKNQYRTMIRTGNVSAQDTKWLEDMARSNQNYRSNLLIQNWGDLPGSYLDYVTQIFNGIKSGAVYRGWGATFKYLIGEMTGQYNTLMTHEELRSLRESPYYNYYTNGNNGIYNEGDTNYYSVYNQDTNQFYDFTTNNYYTVNNYYLNFETNYYTYNIDASVTYNVYNDYSSTNVYYIVNGVNENQYSYYFKMPDGTNSYNLTAEDINGLRTDFNIKNYQSITNYNDLEALYHFDNDKKNSAYANTNYLKFPVGNSIDFGDGAINFGQALLFNQNDIKLQYQNQVHNVSFRFKPMFNTYFTIKQLQTGIGFETTIQKVYNNETSLVNTNGTNQIMSIYEIKSSPKSKKTSYPTNPFDFSEFSIANCNTQNGSSTINSYVVIDSVIEYDQQYNFYYVTGHAVRVCKLIQNVNNTSQAVITNRTDSLLYDQYSKSININAWNTFEMDWNGTTYDIYINGSKVFTTTTNQKRWATTEFLMDGSLLIDEYRVLTTSPLDHNPSALPTNDNTAFVLPENVETNNQILIKSLLAVDGWQIGGVRPSLANTGYVYVYVDDFGYMKSLQQFDGSTWIDIDGALYNQNLGKWVDYNGFSIYLNNFDYQYNQDITIYSIVDDFSFYQWLQQEINRIIFAINSISINQTSNYINNTGQATNFWDFLIALMETAMQGLSSIGDTLIKFIEWLFIPSEDLSITFNNNIDMIQENLGFLWIPFEFSHKIITDLDLSNVEGNFVFNGFEFMGVELIPSFDFDIYSVMTNNNSIYQLRYYYFIVIKFMCVIALIHLARSKLNNFLGGKDK